nr:NAD-dependent epimerase/dehydratase family protein [uncultured Cohaesibacter sp.]
MVLSNIHAKENAHMNDASPRETVLVTGGSGFVAGWTIFRLLETGYDVKTSLRSLSRQDEIIASIARMGGDVNRLCFAKADLSADEGWQEAVEGCAYVIHTASPISQNAANGNDLVGPARDGSLRILRAAASAGVRRVVQTSSLNAAQLPASGPKAYVTDETRWTDTDDRGVGEYQRSKTLAERAAWDFIEQDTSGMTLTTILPGMIIGPVMTDSVHGSVELIDRMLSGRMPLIPRLGYIMSDVRDLVEIHLKAMTCPAAANQRFAAAGDFLWLTEVAGILREHYGERIKSIPSRTLPDFVVHIAALFQREAKFIEPMLGQRIEADIGKAERLLGWRPRSSRQAVLDCAESLLSMKKAQAR